jgi:outer membrane murein-binding lipoprotein Lpp
VLAGSAAHPVNRAALACSVNFINAFVQYVDTKMDMLHVQSGFSKKDGWSLITQLIYRIFMDMSAVREGTLASIRSDDPVEACASVLWCVFHTQDKMAEFVFHGIGNHSSNSSEYVNFLASHSSVGDIDKLQKEVGDATKSAKAAKDEAVKATTKSDKASTQADKAAKSVVEVAKIAADLQ